MTRNLYAAGAVAGVMLICAGGLAAAIPALVAMGGLALTYHCAAKLGLKG